MKLLINLTVICLLLILVSCSDDSTSPKVKQFYLTLDTVTADVPLQVVYSSTRTGDTKIDQIIYSTGDGPQILTNPPNPWISIVSIDKGGKVYMSINGTLTSGSVSIKMSGSGTGGGGSQSFSDSTGTSQY